MLMFFNICLILLYNSSIGAGPAIQKCAIVPGFKGRQTNKPTITTSCYVCREVCTEFYGNTGKDTEIRPGVNERFRENDART